MPFPTEVVQSIPHVTSKFVSISDRADISLAASLIGMLASRMVEPRRAAVYHLAQWLKQFKVVDHHVADCVGALETVFGAFAAPIPSSTNCHQFVPVVGDGVPRYPDPPMLVTTLVWA